MAAHSFRYSRPADLIPAASVPQTLHSSMTNIPAAPFAIELGKKSHAYINDTALALCKVLDEAFVSYGIFGDYAIAALGGPRVSDDIYEIRCIADLNKARAIAMLNGKNGFQYVGGPKSTWEDVVPFRWLGLPGDEGSAVDGRGAGHAAKVVTISVYVTTFPSETTRNLVFKMQNTDPELLDVVGEKMGKGEIVIMGPVLLFKAQLCELVRTITWDLAFHPMTTPTGVQRHREALKHKEAIHWLEQRSHKEIKQQCGEIDLMFVGVAVVEYPDLGPVFARIGLDVAEARAIADDCWDLKLRLEGSSSLISKGDMQSRLLGKA